MVPRRYRLFRWRSVRSTVDGALGRRPGVLGSGLDVWEIVEVAKDNRGSVTETASYLEIDPRLLESALRYYGSDRDEVEGWIARVDALSEGEERSCALRTKRTLLESCCSTSISSPDRPSAQGEAPR